MKEVQRLGEKSLEEKSGEKALEEKVAQLDHHFPFIPFTDSSRLFSTVRRMQQEKRQGIPLNLRSRFAVPVTSHNDSHELSELEWEHFYNTLLNELKQKYPELYNSLMR